MEMANGETPLMAAAVNGDVDQVRALLAAGGDPNAQNERGETALMWAVAYSEEEATRLLLAESTIDPNIVDDLGWNALMVAAWVGNIGAIRLLAPKTKMSHKTIAGATVADIANAEGSPADRLKAANAVRKELGPNKSGGLLGRLWKTLRRKKGGRSKTKSKNRGTR
jgi:ankyrin repeat protein